MPDEPAFDLSGLRKVVDGPLHEIARRLSRYLSEWWPHTALVIFTHECTGRPRKVAGAAATIDKVTIPELEALKSAVEPGQAIRTTASIGGGRSRTVWAVRDPSDTLLVVIPRRTQQPRLSRPALLAAVFGLVATSIRQQVAQASPDYLAESRAASAERARTIAELAAAHEAALVSILTTLRSTSLGDNRARRAAADTASAALVALRSAPTSDRALSEEDAPAAFAKLRREIRQMLRHHEVPIEFTAPARTGRPLPGEIAYAARAMTRTAALAFTAQAGLTRLRIAWTTDDATLRIDIRDQGAGELDTASLHRQLHGRTGALGAAVDLEWVPGWGSRATIAVPLSTLPHRPTETRLAQLNRREIEVLRLLAQGKRNKTIAEALNITESTVKFHVAGVFRKLEVTSRGEAAALALGTELTDVVH